MQSTLAPLNCRARRRRWEEFERLCRERGFPLTSQRLIILKTVLSLGSHPTADEVHASPLVRRAGISRATVYRTLENMVQMGAITKACHPGGVVRYDGRIELHHHLICLRCDAVLDIADVRLDRIPIPDTSAFGFDLKDFRVAIARLVPPLPQIGGQEMKRRTVLLLLAAGLVLCAADLVAQKAAGPVPLGLPPLIVPAHNPQTPEKIALGMKLFNDKRFSSTGEVNCAKCHEPDKAFTDSPLQVSEGINKLAGWRSRLPRRSAPCAAHSWDRASGRRC